MDGRASDGSNIHPSIHLKQAKPNSSKLNSSKAGQLKPSEVNEDEFGQWGENIPKRRRRKKKKTLDVKVGSSHYYRLTGWLAVCCIGCLLAGIVASLLLSWSLCVPLSMLLLLLCSMDNVYEVWQFECQLVELVLVPEKLVWKLSMPFWPKHRPLQRVS